MKSTDKLLIGLWALVMVCFGIGAVLIPENVMLPIHWNIKFEVDRWADKWAVLWVGPVLCLLLPVLRKLVLWIEPRRKHMADSRFILDMVFVLLQLLCVLLYGAVLLLGLGFSVDVPSIAAISIGILFVVLGNYMGKIRSNFMLGIRTPWTLSSDNVWNKTHRLAGKLFILLGLMSVLVGLSQAPWVMYLFIAALVSTIVVVIVYSWRLYEAERHLHEE